MSPRHNRSGQRHSSTNEETIASLTRQLHRRRASRPWPIRRLVVPLAGLAFVGAAAAFQQDGTLGTVLRAGCDIKGNISLNTGERIYHLPGQENYDITRISLKHGERWFCSEEEARRTGWRKSKS